MIRLRYINYELPLINVKTGNIVIYIDANSIIKGFYNRTLILEELNYYIEHNKISDKLIIELKQYLGNLYEKFKKFNPKFVIFYDNGISDNIKINPDYKANRINNKAYLHGDTEKELYYYIKQYYFEQIENLFNIKNTCRVIYLENVETDLIPHYIISQNLIDNCGGINLILSVDKDLLQTCKFKNTYQAVTMYKQKAFERKLYDSTNAVSYIKKRDSQLGAEYISLLLSIAGDKSDNLKGVTGYGVIKAEKLILDYKLPPSVFDIKTPPQELVSEFNKVINNFKIIDFDQQISRLSLNTKLSITAKLFD